jgi:hypothetical protein
MFRGLIICAVAAFLTSISAQANTITFTLTEDRCSGGGCGTPPFGTITLVDNGTGAGAFVSVIETLAASVEFAGTGAGDALDFNVAGPVTISGLSSDFTVIPPASASYFGAFLETIMCTTCSGGHTSNTAGPLTFTVSSTTGVTTADFIANGSGYFFASDIVGTTGKTGNVAALMGTWSDPVTAPEPGTMALLLSGAALATIGSVRKRSGAASL